MMTLEDIAQRLERLERMTALQKSVLTINEVALLTGYSVKYLRLLISQRQLPFYRRGNWVIIGIFLVLYTAFGKLYDGFLVSLVRISEMVYSQSVAAIMSDGLMYLIITLLARKPANPLPFVPVITR